MIIMYLVQQNNPNAASLIKSTQISFKLNYSGIYGPPALASRPPVCVLGPLISYRVSVSDEVKLMCTHIVRPRILSVFC